MAAPKVRVWHPVIGRWALVPARAVPLWERSGWATTKPSPERREALDELVRISEELGLYGPDPDPIAAVEGDEAPVPEGDDPTPIEED